VYPKDYLKKIGLARGRYNQIANYVLAQSEINVAIGNKPPEVYFGELLEQCAGAKKKYGGILSEEDLRINLRTHCIPASILSTRLPDYEEFLEERRKLMSLKIKNWFESL
jgi:hypothetical protein